MLVAKHSFCEILIMLRRLLVFMGNDGAVVLSFKISELKADDSATDLPQNPIQQQIINR
jgi:hypothetical protein